MRIIGKFIILSLFVLAVSPQLNLAQDEQIRDKRVTIKVKDVSPDVVFSRLINEYGILIGFEESTLDSNEPTFNFEFNKYAKNPSPEDAVSLSGKLVVSHKFSLDFENARFQDVMDKIVGDMKHYDWEINEGVVNIFPIKGRDKRLKEFLDLRVEDFWLGPGESISEITPRLTFSIPAYKKFLTDNNLIEGTYGAGSKYYFRTLPDGMRFQDKSFKELLNAITKAKGGGGWILQIQKLYPSTQPDIEYLILFI